jgi:D-aminopeptidase
MTRTALLIADLEGITGVDTLDALVVGSTAYPAAARRMTDEVAFVARLLRAQGIDRVRISDAHRSGADINLDVAALPDGCEVHVTDDMYGGALLDNVDVVACVGMHASGMSSGFGAHTVSAHTAWFMNGVPVSETQLVQWLAGERGIPVWFSAGDDVLQAELTAVPYVLTKRSRSCRETQSLPLLDVERAFAAVLDASPLHTPAGQGALELRFRHIVEATAAEAAGAVRVSPTTIRIAPQTTFAAQYAEALQAIAATDEVLLASIIGEPGSDEFARNAAAVLDRRWE